MDNTFGMHFLGSQKRKSIGKVEAHLVTKHGNSAGAGAVGFLGAVLEDVT